MGERARVSAALGAGCGATLVVVATLRLPPLGLGTGTPIGAEDNGDGYRLFCGIGLRPRTGDGLAAWKGGVVTDFAVADPTCGMSVPSSAAWLLRAVALGGDSLSLLTVAWWYAVLVGLVVGLAAWAASAGSSVRGAPWRAAVVLLPVVPLALPAFSRFFVSTYGEPAGLLGALAMACGTTAAAAAGRERRRERRVALALVLLGGGIAATAKVGYLPVLAAALVVTVAAVVRGGGRRPVTARPRLRRAAVVAGALAALVAVGVPVGGAMHFQKTIYEGANVHDVVFTMALVELGPDGPADLGLPAEAGAVVGHGFFNGPPRPTADWWLRATRERPAALRVEALTALARDPGAGLRALGVGLQATTRADLPYIASGAADNARATASSGDVGWSGGRGPELRAVLADDARPAWLPTVLVLVALAAAASVPAWRHRAGRTSRTSRAPAAARWCLGAGLGAVTALGLVATALAGDGYFELFKHVWLAAYVLAVTALCLLAAPVAALTGRRAGRAQGSPAAGPG